MAIGSDRHGLEREPPCRFVTPSLANRSECGGVRLSQANEARWSGCSPSWPSEGLSGPLRPRPSRQVPRRRRLFTSPSWCTLPSLNSKDDGRSAPATPATSTGMGLTTSGSGFPSTSATTPTTAARAAAANPRTGRPPTNGNHTGACTRSTAKASLIPCPRTTGRRSSTRSTSRAAARGALRLLDRERRRRGP